MDAATSLTRAASAAAALLVSASTAAAQTTPRPLTELTLDELANIEITSVSRYAEPLSRAPAAIFVITADDIRRSGVTTLAEALRLAPNLQVARVDAGQYAITARGFNGVAANKLLVLLDGRTLYTPLFSGVFWDQQDVLLEDVARIEVISGPGATLWGANAVNGVINITTRPARDTQGALASLGAGGRQQGGAFRYGGAFGDRTHARVYGKATHVAHSVRADGMPVLDEREWLQAGVRVDAGDDIAAVTIQGDVYRVQTQDRGSAAGLVIGRAELTGQHLLARWTRRRATGGELRVQAYVDHARRRERVLFQPESTLFDVELQHASPVGNHHLVWGAGYRYGGDEVADGFLVGFRPTGREMAWGNAYAQDTIRLHRAVEATVGLKLERNGYTGWEYMPNGRLAWTLATEHLLWGGVSRAVRAPARFDRDVIRPLGGVFGGQNFVSEVATVVQLGYRGRTGDIVNWSITAYRHYWDRLRSATAPPVFLENRMEGPVDGLEGWATWQLGPAWRIHTGLTLLRKDLRLEPGSTDPLGPRNSLVASDPAHQWMLRSSFTPRARHELDAVIRRVGALDVPVVPAYTAIDARYGWRIRADVEVSVVGQNLFDRRHPEFGALPGRAEHERALFLKATWWR